MSQKNFISLLFFIVMSGCTTRPLLYTDDFHNFAETAKKLKKATIYFRDSTYSTASTIETDGHMIYWIDQETKTNQEDLLNQVEKITFRDHESSGGIGALAGGICAYFLLRREMQKTDKEPEPAILNFFPFNLFQAVGMYSLALIYLGTGSSLGGLTGYGIGIPITYTVSDSLR